MFKGVSAMLISFLALVMETPFRFEFTASPASNDLAYGVLTLKFCCLLRVSFFFIFMVGFIAIFSLKVSDCLFIIEINMRK